MSPAPTSAPSAITNSAVSATNSVANGDFSHVPRLSDYGISETTGFLPRLPPLQRLPSYFEPWERIVDDLPHYLAAWKLRQRIYELTELDTDRLDSQREYQRAFLILSILSHSYVWGAKGEAVLQVLPRNLAKPWLRVSRHLGLRPISCHAALVYYNWKLLDSSPDPLGTEDINLGNLATLHTVSGGIDESWFYLVTVAIEACGAPALPLFIRVLQQVDRGLAAADFVSMAFDLGKIADCIAGMTDTLLRMPENCDPYIFFHRVRIYFSGWSNMKDLPHGLVYEGDENEIDAMFIEEGENSAVDDTPVPLQNPQRSRKYPGGSAAQSALIHALDIFLGVHHYPTGTDVETSFEERQRRINFLSDMRYHMPREYRAFLRDLERAPSLSAFLREAKESAMHYTDGSALRNAILKFDKCIENLKIFRDKHIQIVTRYIVIQARRAAQIGQLAAEGIGYVGMGPNARNVINLNASDARQDPLVTNDGLGDVSAQPPVSISDDSRGTGGTDIMPFLKQSRDETYASRILG